MDLNKLKKQELIDLIYKANGMIESLTMDIIDVEKENDRSYCCNAKAMNEGVDGRQCTEVFGGCDKCKENYYEIRLEQMIEKNQVWDIR